MIYVLEDDDNIRELVVYTLGVHGFEAKGFSLPSELWAALDTDIPSLLFLDIMLPDEDGIEILKKMRKSPSFRHIPIIMLTAKNSEYDKVVGLDNGADDYIVKPFGMMELISRMKALLRRTEDARRAPDEFQIGDLYVSPAKHIVKSKGAEVQLTYKEFELLCKFIENPSVVLTRDQLLNDIWGYNFDGESRTVDVHIRTLRQKLGDSAKYIQTVRGIGYKLGKV